MPRYEEFGSTLTPLRKAAGYGQQIDLANRLSVAQQTISRWEKGTSRPRVEDIPALAQALGIDDIDTLIRAAGYSAKATAAAAMPLIPFPIETLSPDAFERFSLQFLSSANQEHGAQVNRFGGQGHKQEGLDILMREPDGRVITFQCKRHQEFGPSNVREAVFAHTYPADQKIILLTRTATPGARKEVANHAGWDIWDKDDISLKIRQQLSPDQQRRLVDAFFPGQRMALIGQDEAGPWQKIEEFFAQFKDETAIFSHAWKLVGRDAVVKSCLEKLAFPNTKVIALVGAGGSGKSRILLEVLDQFSKSTPNTTVRLLAPSEEPTSKSLDQLGQGRKLLVVDDAHDHDHLKLLFQRAASDDNVQLLLCLRPYGVTKVQADASNFVLFGERFIEIKIEPLTIAQATTLAAEVLDGHDIPAEVASDIARFTYDCPLATVISAHMVASKQVPLALVANEVEFRTQLLGRFQNVIAGELGGPAHTLLFEKVLRLVALLQPIAIDGDSLARVALAVENIPEHDTKQVVAKLAAGGVLFKRGRNYRLSPDLLADFIIQQTCLGPTGQSLGYAEKVFAHARPDQLQNLITNISKLDWRLSKSDVSSGKRVLDAVWGQLEAKVQDTHPTLMDTISAAAIYQPQRSLEFAVECIRKGNIPRGLARMLRSVAHHFECLHDACECLWAMSAAEHGLPRQRPDHAIRVLTELCEVELRKPIEYNEIVVDFGLSLLPKSSSWQGTYTPLDFLSGILKTDGHSTSARGNELHFKPFLVRPEAVRPLREKTIDAGIELLTHRDTSIAVKATKFLESALRHPIGTFGAVADSDLHNRWAVEFCATLRKLVKIAESGALSDIVHFELATSVAWLAQHGSGDEPKLARAIIDALPQDLESRLGQALMTGWRRVYYTGDVMTNEQQWNESLNNLADELLEHESDVSALLGQINHKLEKIKAAKLEGNAHPLPFLLKLFSRSEVFSEVVVDQLSSAPNSPIAPFADHALAWLLKANHDIGFEYVRQLWRSNDASSQLIVAGAYSAYRPEKGLTSEEITVLKTLFSTGSEQVVERALNVFPAVVQADKRAAIDMFKSIDLASSTKVVEEALPLLRNEGVLRLKLLERGDIEAILERLTALQDLEGYWIQSFLADLSGMDPALTLRFFLARLERAANDQSIGYRVIWPHTYPAITFTLRDQAGAETCLNDLLDWMTAHVNNAESLYEAGEVFASLFGPLDETLLASLNRALLIPDSSALRVLIALIRRAGDQFVFTHKSDVMQLLDLAEGVDRELVDTAISALYGSAISGVSNSIPGQPSPKDLKIKTESEKILTELSRLSPAYHLYDDLRKHAEQSIDLSRRLGRRFSEDDEVDE